MHLKYSWWVFKKCFSDRFCDDIVKEGKTKITGYGITGGEGRDYKKNPITKKELKDKRKIRHSKVGWINQPWLYKEIDHFVGIANRNAGWNFQYDWFEDCQFGEYTKSNHYNWHMDQWQAPYGKDVAPSLIGKIRKLSVVVSLSDPKDYKGGQFQVRVPSMEHWDAVSTVKELVSRGSMLVFPSFLWHKVKPVTKGKRYSLVAWGLGAPFK